MLDTLSELFSTLGASANAISAMLPEMGTAVGQTLTMLGIGLSAAVLIGGPLGIVLFLVADGQSLQNRPAALVLGWMVNTVRSFPFIILLVALVPFCLLYTSDACRRSTLCRSRWSPYH